MECFQETQWYASATFIMAFSAVEAHFREIARYQEVDTDMYNEIDRLSDPLERHQKLLEFLGKNKFVRGNEPTQSMNLLRKVRNELMHFQPSYRNEGGSHDQLTDNLSRLTCSRNPFVSSDEELFPRGCMSHGYAEWAVNSALSYIQEFRKKCDIPMNNFEKEKLSTIE